jgi:hypothetical protein
MWTCHIRSSEYKQRVAKSKMYDGKIVDKRQYAVKHGAIQLVHQISYLTVHIPLFVASITIGDNELSKARLR